MFKLFKPSKAHKKILDAIELSSKVFSAKFEWLNGRRIEAAKEFGKNIEQNTDRIIGKVLDARVNVEKFLDESDKKLEEGLAQIYGRQAQTTEDIAFTKKVCIGIADFQKATIAMLGDLTRLYGYLRFGIRDQLLIFMNALITELDRIGCKKVNIDVVRSEFMKFIDSLPEDADELDQGSADGKAGKESGAEVPTGPEPAA